MIHCSGEVKKERLSKKATHWAIPAGLEGVAPVPEKRPTLRKGSRGEAVKECQEKLMALGYDVGSTGADGIYGTKTEEAVRTFQKEHALGIDGICGPKTGAALDAAQPGSEPEPQERTWTVTIHGVTEDLAKSICAAWFGSTMTEE